MLLTLGLLRYYIPRRLVFPITRAAFQQLVQQAPVSTYRGKPLNQHLGIFFVDEYAADSRGGVYFRTYVGHDGIGPDQMSYGFAYQPNPRGTPFGAARYIVRPLGQGWYWFRASDDWY